MGFYQVVRYIGFSLGSALAAAILAVHTPHGADLPGESGYVTAAWIAAGICAFASLVARILSTERRPAEDTRASAPASA